MRFQTTKTGRGRSYLFLPGVAVLAALALAACGQDPDPWDDQDPYADEMAPGEMPPADWGVDRPGEPMGAALPEGTALTFRFDDEISAGSHSAGDEFTLRLTEDVTGPDGIVLEEGTEAKGVITAVHAADDPEHPAIEFEIRTIEIDGEEVFVEVLLDPVTPQVGDDGLPEIPEGTIVTLRLARPLIVH